MSNFRVSMVEDSFSLGTSTTPKKLFDLPNSHPISAIYLRDRVTHATSTDITQDLIEVLLDGSPVIAGTSGVDLSRINKFDTGHQFTEAPAAGADVVLEQIIRFGRFPRDEKFALPAPLFSNVQLRLNDTHAAAPVLHEVSIAVEEILGVDPEGLTVRRRSLLETFAGAAGQHDTKLALGNRTGGLYVFYADVDNVDGAVVQMGVNNFTTNKFNARRTSIEAVNRASYPFDDNALPTATFFLDFDAFGIEEKALDLRSGISDAKLRVTGAASGTSGNVRIVQEDYVPVRKG